jgi:hypothetical protein
VSPWPTGSDAGDAISAVTVEYGGGYASPDAFKAVEDAVKASGLA